MNYLKTRYAVPGCLLLMLSGCIDNNYDLSNLDTTTRLQIDNLTLPVKIEPVTLNDVIDVKEGDDIEEVTINGKTFYAVKQTGEFNSDPIHIASFETEIPAIDKAYATYKLSDNLTASKRRREDNGLITLSHKYTLHTSDPQEISFDANNIDASIHDITSAVMEPLHINMAIESEGLGSNVEIEFTKLTLDFLPGLEVVPNSGYNYNKTTGVLEIHDLKAVNNKAEVTVIANGIDLKAANNGVSPFDYSRHSLIFKNKVQIIAGELNYIVKIDPTQTPDISDEINFVITTTADTPGHNDNRQLMNITNIAGQIEYKLDGSDLKIDPVDLSSLPDFLADKETHLKLANPQILFNVKNPVAVDELKVTTGLKLTSVNNGVHTTTSINKTQQNPDGVVEVGYDKGVGPYNILISPSKDNAFVTGIYDPITNWVEFTGLRNILFGDGLPQTIEIELENPQIPLQTVKNFALGVDLEGTEGHYEFLAPLALANEEDVQIVYSKTWDDWNDKDVDKFAIRELTLSAVATSTIPLNATMTAVPLVIGADGAPVIDRTAKCKAIVLPGEASNAPISISIIANDPEKPIRHLAGIRIQALVTPHNNEPLAPEQTISLTDIKAAVSGYYDITDDKYEQYYND